MDKSRHDTLRAALFEAIDKQIHENTPPETRITYNRLIASGESHQDTYRLIGSVVTSEVFAVLNRGREYNEDTYIKALRALPTLPWDHQPKEVD